MNVHVHRIRARYVESDQMGVVHHAAYIAWLEEARIEWLRVIGISYRELEQQGVLMPVVDLTIAYKRSLRFDDVAELTTTAVVKGPSRTAFTTVIRLAGDEQVRAEAMVTVAAMTPEGKPCRLPPAVAAALAP